MRLIWQVVAEPGCFRFTSLPAGLTIFEDAVDDGVGIVNQVGAAEEFAEVAFELLPHKLLLSHRALLR